MKNKSIDEERSFFPPLIKGFIALALWIIITFLLTLLSTLAVNYLMEDSKTKEELDRYRRYHHLNNDLDSGDEYISD